MAARERATSTLQENVLTLLCFDSDTAPIIRNFVSTDLFTTEMFRTVADVAVDFLDEFGEPPGEHLPDLFEPLLAQDDRTAKLYKQLLRNLHTAHSGINKEYVLSSLNDFVRRQTLQVTITEAAKALRSGDAEEAESIIEKNRGLRAEAFEPGTVVYRDVSAVLDELSKPREFISTGIPELDHVSFGPTRKALLTVLAPTSRGKTWALVHLGKQALMRKQRVLHITLEMSEGRTVARYFQNMFSITRRQTELLSRKFKTHDGEFDGFTDRVVERPTLTDPKTRSYIARRVKQFPQLRNLIVKEFPTGALTMPLLNAYLDNLERIEKFIPDLILIDYADLFRLGAENLRLEVGQVFKDLRGIGVSRNIAIVTATQANRLGEDAPLVTVKHLAEDYSKAATSDMVLSYNQTDLEKAHNLARLFVAKNRDEEDGVTALVTQQYGMGQFVLSSMRMNATFWDALEREAPPRMVEGGRAKRRKSKARESNSDIEQSQTKQRKRATVRNRRRSS